MPGEIYSPGDGNHTPEEVSYFCRACGWHERNTATWCESGCGRDYNQMIPIPTWHVVQIREEETQYVLGLLESKDAALRVTEETLGLCNQKITDLEAELKRLQSLALLDLSARNDLEVLARGRLEELEVSRLRFTVAAGLVERARDLLTSPADDEGESAWLRDYDDWNKPATFPLCTNCWNGITVPCAVGCGETDECCDKLIGVPCPYCAWGKALAR